MRIVNRAPLLDIVADFGEKFLIYKPQKWERLGHSNFVNKIDETNDNSNSGTFLTHTPRITNANGYNEYHNNANAA